MKIIPTALWRTYAVCLGSLAVFCFAPRAAAAPQTRYVCFDMRVKYESTLDNCPLDSSDGVRRPCAPGDWAAAVGHRVEIWDKDPGGVGDHRLATTTIGGSGLFCTTIFWDPVAEGEADPDLFLKMPLEVRSTTDVGATLRAVRNDGTDYPSITWRGADGDDQWVRNDCPQNTTCRIYTGFMSTSTQATLREREVVQFLDFGQRSLQVYGSAFGTGEIRLEYPSTTYGSSTGSCPQDTEDPACCPGAGAWSENDFCVTTDYSDSGDVVNHELGHILQQRQFPGPYTGSACSSWSPPASVNEKCATQEGWAMYAGSVAWWNPDVPNEATYGGSFNMELATPFNSTCALNKGIPWQVAKAFWDLDDQNQENGVSPTTAGWNDTQFYPTSSIVLAWGAMSSGTGNGQSGEPGPNGVNIWDFQKKYFGSIISSTGYIMHNCLNAQDSTGY